MVHVDASKKSCGAARANAELSGMADKPIFAGLSDDAAKFVAREVRRGRRYDGILLDPPKIWPRTRRRNLAAGRGSVRPRRQLPGAVGREQALPVPHRLCGADVGAGDRELLRQAFADLPGKVEAGELAVREEARGLLLPTAIWRRAGHGTEQADNRTQKAR